MIINVDCALRTCEPICLPLSATGRDVYIEISANINLSRKYFKVLYDSQLIHDSLIILSDYGLISGCLVTLVPNITSGSISTNFNQLDPARQAIRNYAFSLPINVVQGFFKAEEQLKLRIPVGNQWGTLKFKLDAPMPVESVTMPDDLYSDMSMLHMDNQSDERTYTGTFCGK